MEELITIAEFDDSNQAHVLRSRLEADGIEVFLRNENMNAVLPGSGFTRVQVLVRLSDSFRAMDVLYSDQ